MRKEYVASVGSLLGSILTILVTLKLSGSIEWSWWIVLSPLWLPISGIGAVFMVWFVWYAYFKMPDEKRRQQYGVNEFYWKEYKRKHNL